MPERIRCAGAVVFDVTGRLLMIERGQPPSMGTWSVPGGRCLTGESAAAACTREVLEETGLVVVTRRWVGAVERDAPNGATFVIDDYLCDVQGGYLHAASDAADARWMTRADLAERTLAPGLWSALAGWHMLPT